VEAGTEEDGMSEDHMPLGIDEKNEANNTVNVGKDALTLQNPKLVFF